MSKSHFRRLRFDQNNSGLMSGPDSISDPVARRLCSAQNLTLLHVYWRHDYIMMTPSLFGSGTWVGSSGIRVGSAHPGEEDACDTWRASVRVGSLLAGACLRVLARAAVSDVRFRCGFQQWLRLFLLYTVVWSKHNFDNFHF